ncbi:MAG: hypothetical protein GY754_04205 [bacterium]|nr:hypothetical protein [bacterium]
MIKNKKNTNVVAINWIDKAERWILVPGYANNKRIRRIKELSKVKENCYFTTGVAKKLIDFIYRSVIKLGLGEITLIFSRGAVKRYNRSVHNAVDICELDWDVGTSLIIPRTLKYGKTIQLLVDNEEHTLRLMEIIVLRGLLQVARPKKSSEWYSAMAATIITKGWSRFEEETPGKIFLPGPPPSSSAGNS